MLEFKELFENHIGLSHHACDVHCVPNFKRLSALFNVWKEKRYWCTFKDRTLLPMAACFPIQMDIPKRRIFSRHSNIVLIALASSTCFSTTSLIRTMKYARCAIVYLTDPLALVHKLVYQSKNMLASAWILDRFAALLSGKYVALVRSKHQRLFVRVNRKLRYIVAITECKFRLSDEYV